MPGAGRSKFRTRDNHDDPKIDTHLLSYCMLRLAPSRSSLKDDCKASVRDDGHVNAVRYTYVCTMILFAMIAFH